MEENKINQKIAKIGVVGDTQVGKTAICYTFIGVDFSSESREVFGPGKFNKKVKLKNNEEMEIIIWDIAGAERYRNSAFKIIKNVEGIILVFNICNKRSFENLISWLEQAKEELNNPFTIIFGNKNDMDYEKWEISSEEVNTFIRSLQIPYFEVSAKTGIGIEEGFSYIINEIYNKKLENNKDTKEIKINKDSIAKEKNKSDCVRNKKKK